MQQFPLGFIGFGEAGRALGVGILAMTFISPLLARVCLLFSA
jgi:hypothetical protein